MILFTSALGPYQLMRGKTSDISRTCQNKLTLRNLNFSLNNGLTVAHCFALDIFILQN